MNSSDYDNFSNDSDCKKQNMWILGIQEKERQRIAMDLHDRVLQNLAHIVHKVEYSGMFIETDPVRAKLELSLVNRDVRNIIDEIRNTIFDLRPMTFDDIGLDAALQDLIQIKNKDKKYQVESSIENPNCADDLTLVTIYRLVQECFSNIEKHAEATKVEFRCKNEGKKYCVDINDNGKGFLQQEISEKEDKHFGITVMKERVSLLGGTLTIESKVGKGTQVHIEIPLI